MHEIHCRRNIVLCPVCDEAVPKSNLADHHEENHTETPCPLCKQSITKDHLDDHTVILNNTLFLTT